MTEALITSALSGTPTAPLLEGVRVLDLSSVGPASRATRVLSDFGASVTKIGPVPSDDALMITPPHYAYSGQRAMERAALDLKAESGRAALYALVEDADVLVESFRPGVTDRLGIGYDALSTKNPRLVYCSTSGFGQRGPLSQTAGHDVDYLAVGGFLATSERRADGGPPLPGATVADAAAGGLHAALSICAALVGRQETGRGCYLDVAIADGVLWLMSLAIDEHLAIGTEPGPGHDLLTGGFACYTTYEASDGRWLAVGAIEPKFFATLCTALGCSQWIGSQMDPALQPTIRADFAAAFLRSSRDDWIDLLGQQDTCVAPVLSVSEIPESSHVAARGLVVEATHPTHGTFRQLAPLLAGMVRGDGVVHLPDLTRTTTTKRLASAGVSSEQIAQWQEEGAIA
jgi:alpha-methylacyl-CoA racemase